MGKGRQYGGSSRQKTSRTHEIASKAIFCEMQVKIFESYRPCVVIRILLLLTTKITGSKAKTEARFDMA